MCAGRRDRADSDASRCVSASDCSRPGGCSALHRCEKKANFTVAVPALYGGVHVTSDFIPFECCLSGTALTRYWTTQGANTLAAWRWHCETSNILCT